MLVSASLTSVALWAVLPLLSKVAIAASGLSYNGLAQTPQMGWVRLPLTKQEYKTK